MFCRFCGKENTDGARFCTGCGKPLHEEDAGSFRESGSQVAPFAGSRPETAPLEEKDKEKPSSRTGTEKKLLIVLCALVAAILVAVIFLVVAVKPWGDKSGNRGETDIERDQDENDSDDEDNGGERDVREDDSREEKTAGEEESPEEAGNAGAEEAEESVDPSEWMAGYQGWLEAHEEMLKISLVAIDDDDIPECLVWREDGNGWDSTLYVLSYGGNGIAEYSVTARDICFEVLENSGRFACMTYSGLGTGWDMVELSDSGFTKVGETYSGHNPENDEIFYTVNSQDMDQESYMAYIAGFTGDIEICYGEFAGDDKNKISISGQDYEKALQDSYALWSVGGFRDNDRYWESVQ